MQLQTASSWEVKGNKRFHAISRRDTINEISPVDLHGLFVLVSCQWCLPSSLSPRSQKRFDPHSITELEGCLTCRVENAPWTELMRRVSSSSISEKKSVPNRLCVVINSCAISRSAQSWAMGMDCHWLGVEAIMDWPISSFKILLWAVGLFLQKEMQTPAQMSCLHLYV